MIHTDPESFSTSGEGGLPDREMVTDEREGEQGAPGRVEITWRPSVHDERLALRRRNRTETESRA